MLKTSNLRMESEIFISDPYSRALGIDSYLLSFVNVFQRDSHDPLDDSLVESPSQISHLNLLLLLVPLLIRAIPKSTLLPRDGIIVNPYVVLFASSTHPEYSRNVFYVHSVMSLISSKEDVCFCLVILLTTNEFNLQCGSLVGIFNG